MARWRITRAAHWIFVGRIGLGATLVLGGRARKITPLIYPLILKTFLVTKRVAVGATEIIPSYFCAIFQADAEFDVKSAVASYFWAVFGHFLGQNFGQNFVFFVYVAPHSYQQMLGLW